MIQTIIDLMDAAIAAFLPTATRHGLAELHQVEGGGTHPVVYADNGSFVPIANDNAGTFSYWRMASNERTKGVDVLGKCAGGYEVTMPLRFVAMVDREICPIVANAARSATWAAMDTDGAIRSTTNAMIVDFTSSAIETDARKVYRQEFGRELDNANKAFVALDFTVVVTGDPQCFAPCDTESDILCRIIQAQQWAQIQACLTDAQEAAAIAALCGLDTCEQIALMGGDEVIACIPDGNITVAGNAIMARDPQTPDVIVEQITNAGKLAGVEAIICTPCPPATSFYWRAISLGT